MAKRDKDLNFERDCALYKAYRRALKTLYDSCEKTPEGMRGMHEKAIKMAINTPQERFWISQDRTARILWSLIRGDKWPRTWPTRKLMQVELMNAYNRLRHKRMFEGMSTRFVASFVTFEHASGFFMSYSRAKRAIYRQMQLRKAGNT